MPLKDPEARRAYNRTYNRERWYPANRQAHMARVHANDARRLAEIRAEVDEIKRQPCADCGHTFAIECMDLDHVRGDKVANVADMLQRGKASVTRIRAEIAKCEAVCANCHRIRTAARRITT